MTEARRVWLKHLARNGPAKADGWGTAPFYCRKLGWTEWACHEHETGRVITYAEFQRRHPKRPFMHGEIVGEFITDEGREALVHL
ncbi:MAG: hypothetical protein VX464_20720 [Pseudomonadota bacterium]|nr:hypothetical protein [Pseudomonadota bacterium]